VFGLIFHVGHATVEHPGREIIPYFQLSPPVFESHGNVRVLVENRTSACKSTFK
jgi:hypothetical protein